MKKIYLSLLFAGATMFATAQQVISFEQQVLNNDGYWCGDESGVEYESWGAKAYACKYIEDGVFFNVNYTPSWGSWSGYAISNRTETTFSSITPDQYNNITGTAKSGNNFCLVQTYGETIDMAGSAVVKGFWYTNNAWTVYAILNGDGMATDDGPFGTDDWLKCTVTGTKADKTIATVDIMLAENGTYVNEWKYADLSSLGEVVSLSFSFSGTKQNSYGLTTPAYMCIDDMEIDRKSSIATFEDITIEGTESFWADKTQAGVNPWNSQDYTLDTYYADYGYDYFADYVVSNCTATDGTSYDKPYQSTAGGAKNGNNYAVFYLDTWSTVDGAIYLATPSRVSGFWACNTTYAAYGIKNWDGQSSDQKPFGQDDYFKLIITGYDINGEVVGTVEQMLIDCTDANEWHYIKDWRWVDLTSLGNNVMYVKFSFDGTKKNDWGLTTPTYVCIDDFGGDAPAKNTPYEVIEQPTAIDNVAAEKSNNAVRKFFKDGRFVIAKDGKLFNASGAEVK